MQLFLILILSISGLSWIVTQSKIFKAFREKITYKRGLYEIAVKSTTINCINSNTKLSVYTFLDNILNCYGCFGFWSGAICYLLDFFHLDIVLMALSGTVISLIVIGFINFLNRK